MKGTRSVQTAKMVHFMHPTSPRLHDAAAKAKSLVRPGVVPLVADQTAALGLTGNSSGLACHRSTGDLAALTSSGRLIGVLSGAS